MIIFSVILVTGFLAALSILFWQLWLSHKSFVLGREISRMIYHQEREDEDQWGHGDCPCGAPKIECAVFPKEDGYVVAANPWD